MMEKLNCAGNGEGETTVVKKTLSNAKMEKEKKNKEWEIEEQMWNDEE